MQFDINITGLDPLAASITALAEALKAGVTANEVIAKASTRKPKPAAVETKTYPDGTQATGTAPLPDQSPAEAGNADAGVLVADTTSSSTTSAETDATTAAPKTPSDSATGATPTIVEVRAAIAALAKTDKAKALGILTKFGAQSVSSLKPEHYAAALAEAQ